MEKFKELLLKLAGDVAWTFSDEDTREDRSEYDQVNIHYMDSYEELIRYFEERTQRPLDWVKVALVDETRRKVFSAGRGSHNWRVDLTDLTDEQATAKMREIHPLLYCKDGYPHVPPEAITPAVISPVHSYGVLPAGEKRPFRCPICNGDGFHHGDVLAGGDPLCRACKGACIVWGQQMATRKKHAHLRPNSSDPSWNDKRFVVDWYAANGRWTSSGYYDTKKQAIREMDLRRKREDRGK